MTFYSTSITNRDPLPSVEGTGSPAPMLRFDRTLSATVATPIALQATMATRIEYKRRHGVRKPGNVLVRYCDQVLLIQTTVLQYTSTDNSLPRHALPRTTKATHNRSFKFLSSATAPRLRVHVLSVRVLQVVLQSVSGSQGHPRRGHPNSLFKPSNLQPTIKGRISINEDQQWP